ncbi:hypothetical protein [Methylocystis echinoides]|jgi:hypothetical protein|uniref:hypothetical protein n=1 Tax=Methylocystis echinoides TaxID=29468 RepID=UPI003438173B
MREKIAPTSDALRIRIDRGLAGDKVANPDPAAAPLGTDAEAAGAPPSEQERDMAARGVSMTPTLGQSDTGDEAVVSLPKALAGAALFLLAGAVLVSQRLP